LPAEALLVASAFALSLLVVLAATPLAIHIAERTGFHDHPIGYKGHAQPTPYLGGAAVFAGCLAGALIAGTAGSRLGWILVCALALWVVGTLDDRFAVRPSLRVLAEATAGATLFEAGLGWSITGNTAADLAITVIWIVALSNAFNLMDNMDGAASTVAVFSSLGVTAIALVLDDPTLAALALAVAGACLGFLRYNLARPARIFLGDGGSMPIGFIVGAAIMALPLGDVAGGNRLAVAVLLAGLPVLDTTLVVLSRRRAGVPVLLGGRDHLTHRLARRLGPPQTVAIALGATQAALCAGALWLSQNGQGPSLAAWVLLLCAAAAAVAVMETRTWAPVRPPLETLPALEPEPKTPRQPSLLNTYPLEVVLVTIVAASCGLSPFFYGFYSLEVWGPIALGLLAILFALTIARPAVPRGSALVALAGLAGLAVWALVSRGWAGSPGNALVEANRWVLYATLFAILVLLLRDDQLGKLVLGVATALIVALGLYVLVRLVGGGEGLFLSKRLNEPLGYVNGQASYFLLGIWPLIAVAERARRPWVAGAAAGAATMLAALVLLSQTRAVVPAIVISAAAMLALVPGRVRRGWALAAVAVAVGAIAPVVLHVYDQAAVTVSAGSARGAALAIVGAAIGAGAAWGLATAASSRPQLATQAARRVATIALVGFAVAVSGAALAKVHDPAGLVSRQFDAFTSLQSTQTERNRFLSGGGNRYDYWRIAVEQFRGHPVRGVGAGSYQFDYFRERRTNEDIRQPHSIELQTIAELGLVGGGLLALFVAAALTGLGRRLAQARRSPADAGLTVAAGGIFLVWLAHTSVDWIHLLPGVTGVALAAVAVLLAPWRAAAASPGGRLRGAVVAGCALLVVLAAIGLSRATLADRHARSARAALAVEPVRALSSADRALELNADAVSVYYVRSAAYARRNDYTGARASLLAALRVEPRNFATWALLGDIAVRHGDREQARGYYSTALRLNPRDPQIRQLADHPPTG
jgi:UDP-GlcNAc:undecaprenyl-phosphate GlcNAc-1-phosphate transferase